MTTAEPLQFTTPEELRLESLLNLAPVKLHDLQRKSMGWFLEQERILRNIRPVNPRVFLKQEPLQRQFKLGQMITFLYNPLHSETLPYYDTMPLVLPFNYYDDGFIGLNLHYLHPFQRARLLDRLMPLATAKRMRESSRLRLTWELLNTASRIPLVAPCVKRYLYNRLMTLFRVIPFPDWGSAVILPTDRFKKATRREVWAESAKIARRRLGA